MAWTEATLATDIEAPDGRRVRVRATIRGVWTGEWDRWVWKVVAVASDSHAPGLSADWACDAATAALDEATAEAALNDAAGRVDAAWMRLAGALVEAEARP
jgi:hypothetical protein